MKNNKIYNPLFILIFLIICSSIFCQNTDDSITLYYDDLYNSIQISENDIASKKMVKKKHINGNIKEIHIEIIKHSTDTNLVAKKNPYIRYIIGKCIHFYNNGKIKDITDYNIENTDNFSYKRYYRNGYLEREGNYLNYKKTEIWKYFNKEGKLIKEKHF